MPWPRRLSLACIFFCLLQVGSVVQWGLKDSKTVDVVMSSMILGLTSLQQIGSRVPQDMQDSSGLGWYRKGRAGILATMEELSEWPLK